MRYAFIYDTETTGFPLKERDAAPNDPRQPHIVQIAAHCLNLDTGSTFLTFNTLIKWDGWKCDPKALEVHGKTEELCNEEGMEEGGAVQFAVTLSSGAQVRVAHNCAFDEKIMLITLARFGSPELIMKWLSIPTFCTMEASKGIVKLPPTTRMVAAGMRGYKSPSLKETYKHFFNKDVENAHDALADVRACEEIFYELYKREKESEAS